MLKGNNTQITRDVVLIVISLIGAYFIWENDSINILLENYAREGHLLSAFIAGLFFTSAFTTAPAVAFIIKIAQYNNIFFVALLGATGALIGDTIIFYLVRDRLLKDMAVLAQKKKIQKYKHLLKSKIIRYSLVFIAGVMIALPLFPDEPALAILGASHTSKKILTFVVFTSNFFAILIIHYIVLN